MSDSTHHVPKLAFAQRNHAHADEGTSTRVSSPGQDLPEAPAPLRRRWRLTCHDTPESESYDR